MLNTGLLCKLPHRHKKATKLAVRHSVSETGWQSLTILEKSYDYESSLSVTEAVGGRVANEE